MFDDVVFETGSVGQGRRILAKIWQNGGDILKVKF